MYSEILNPFLNVRNKIKNEDGAWVDQREKRESMLTSNSLSRSITAEDIIIFENWDKIIELESIELGTTVGDIFLQLHVQKEATAYTDQIFHIVSSGSARGPATLERLISDSMGSSYLNVTHHSGINDSYRLELKRPIRLPNGARLVIKSNGQEGLATYKVVWREIER